MRFKIFFKREMLKKLSFLLHYMIYNTQCMFLFLKFTNKLFYYFEIMIQNIRKNIFLIANLIRC